MDFAEKLVDQLIIAVRRHEDSVNTGSEYVELDRLIECRKAIEGALRVPKGDELTVLDRFAMAAMQGELAAQGVETGEWTERLYPDLAKTAYKVADAMLAERSRREAQP